jgi:rhamnose utilization protein RhaD (predicted bifunctional aldolase and dehydrogenase)
MTTELLHELVRMSNALGDPARDWVILGEGNTSARADETTFWVKASGTELRTLGPEHLVRLQTAGVLSLLEASDADDEEVARRLEKAKVDPEVEARPSVEALLHAVCLQVSGVRFVGHTHPTAVNAVTCSIGFEEAVRGRLFPDEIVVCGPAPVVVPYVDPGVPLAKELRRRIDSFVKLHRERPRVIWLQNHGLVALGATAAEVEHVTAMAVKTARILVGTHSFGGPNFLTPGAARRIHSRPDEQYRKRMLGEKP